MLHRFDRALLADPARSGFPTRRAVDFHDVDAAGIVFYARLFDYFHDAYVALLAASGEALPAVLAEKRWAAPLRHAEAEFLRPLRYGDSVEVAIVAARVEGSRATLGYRVVDGSGGVAALGQTTHVFVDPATFEKIAVPAGVAARLADLAGE